MEKRLNINFIDKGSDKAMLKSMAIDEQHEYDQECLEDTLNSAEDLEKAMRDKSKLVQVERQVNGKNGTFTRKYWVAPDQVKKTDRVIGGQQPVDSVTGGNKILNTISEENFPKGSKLYYKGQEAVVVRVGKEFSGGGMGIVVNFKSGGTGTIGKSDLKDVTKEAPKTQPVASDKKDEPKKYTRAEKDDNFRRLSKKLLHLADVGTQTTFDDIAPVNGELEKLYKEGGLFKKDYDNLCDKVAAAQRRAKMVSATKKTDSPKTSNGKFSVGDSIAVKRGSETVNAKITSIGSDSLGDTTYKVEASDLSGKKKVFIVHDSDVVKKLEPTPKTSYTNTGDLSYKGTMIKKVFKHGQTYYKVDGDSTLYSYQRDAKAAADRISKAPKDLKGDTDKDTGETWYEGKLNGKDVRITQEKAGNDSWWNVEIGAPGKREYLRDADGKAMSFQSAREAEDEARDATARQESKKEEKVAGYTKYTGASNARKMSSGDDLHVTSQAGMAAQVIKDLGVDVEVQMEENKDSMTGKTSHVAYLAGNKDDVEKVLTECRKRDSQGKETKPTQDKKPVTKEDAKNFVKDSLKKNNGDKAKTIADFKAMGITWEEKDHPAINWMRANMAAQKFFTEKK